MDVVFWGEVWEVFVGWWGGGLKMVTLFTKKKLSLCGVDGLKVNFFYQFSVAGVGDHVSHIHAVSLVNTTLLELKKPK